MRHPAAAANRLAYQQPHLGLPLALASPQVLESHTRPVLSLAVAGNRLFSGSYDYSIRVWNLDTLQREKTLTGHTDAVRALTVAGGKVFSASYDGTLKVRMLAQQDAPNLDLDFRKGAGKHFVSFGFLYPCLLCCHTCTCNSCVLNFWPCFDGCDSGRCGTQRR